MQQKRFVFKSEPSQKQFPPIPALVTALILLISLQVPRERGKKATLWGKRNYFSSRSGLFFSFSLFFFTGGICDSVHHPSFFPSERKKMGFGGKKCSRGITGEKVWVTMPFSVTRIRCIRFFEKPFCHSDLLGFFLDHAEIEKVEQKAFLFNIVEGV